LEEVIFPLIETPLGPFDPFLNVNTPAELAVAERWLETLQR
jgi:molybdopterin-guanine dinucleotide biosynthesis protein A